MTQDEILSLLGQVLGPLKLHPQHEDSHFDKFQDLLIHVLSQADVEFRKSGVEFPGLHSNILPEDVNEDLENLVQKIINEQANRNPQDPNYWLRQRDIPVLAGIEESIENFIEPAFSFGPFVREHSIPVWFDFFEFSKQLRFEILQGGIEDFLVITLPTGEPLPAAGRHETLNFPDCTIWLSIKTIAPTAAKKYLGIRAKKCELIPSGIIAVQTTGFASILANDFQLSFESFDKFAKGTDNDSQPKAEYAGKTILSFSGTKWSLLSTETSSIHLNGGTIDFEISENSIPTFLETENLVHLPIKTTQESWEILSGDTERFHLGGKARLTDPGWYLPVIGTDTHSGIGILGNSFFSGYLGFKGTDGLLLDWPGLGQGKIEIDHFLLLARPGRTNLKYTYDAPLTPSQDFSTWKAISEGESFSSITITPLPKGTGICINDNQKVEALVQPVTISVKADRPLNANQKRFDISDHLGAIEFLKIGDVTSLVIIGNKSKPAEGKVKKRSLLQSLCLRNALFTTSDPASIFVKGRLIDNQNIVEGHFSLTFRVYKVVNTLPDPYISNQDDVFGRGDLADFEGLFRSGADTVPEQFLFTILSLTHWNTEGTSLEFSMNQPMSTNQLSNDALLSMLRASISPCGPEMVGDFHTEDIQRLVNLDPENVLGAVGYLRLTPGNLSLIDVSDNVNRWGVAFSNFTDPLDNQIPGSLGYEGNFPYRIKNMDLVSSGRLSRLFTLPHIQWEPVMQIDNPKVEENPSIPSIINFADNGAPTRISTSQKSEVALIPDNLYDFIIDGYNNEKNPRAMAAHFSLPFGICAFAYFNPKKFESLPSAIARKNHPSFSGKKTGEISGGLQLHMEAIAAGKTEPNEKDNHLTYFIGAAIQKPSDNNPNVHILGNTMADQFTKEFGGGQNAKVPLERIDFSGYGASIFSKWINESANYGAVSQVRFDVLIGRTAHEVIQIKTILFPCGAPLVRSIVIQRKNTGIVTRFDSGWVAQGPGEFDFRAHVDPEEANPYNFHPGPVKGFYNISEIKELPKTMEIPVNNDLGFLGVYYNADVKIKNTEKGSLPDSKDGDFSMVPSMGQLGYVMIANPAILDQKTTLKDLFPAIRFKELLNNPKIGGKLGGPVNAIINIGETGQRMQLTRVEVTVTNQANTSFVVAVRGNVYFPKEGSWTVVKCLASKEVIPLNAAETVPLIRNGLLSIDANNERTVQFANSHYCLGDPMEIDSYAGDPPNGPTPSLQYGFLQTTGTQKLLFRRPSFSEKDPNKIFHAAPDLADAFRLLASKTIFPNLAGTLSLPDFVRSLNITGEGDGLKFDESFFRGAVNLNNFVPTQLKNDPGAKEFVLLDESGLQIIISYSANDEVKSLSVFQVDLNSDAIEEAVAGERKKYQTIYKDVAIKINLGGIRPLLTLRGTFRSEAGKEPVFENPEAELGDELQAVKDILQILALLTGKDTDSLKVVMGNSPDVYNYKMSIDQNIPVLQFPSIEQITLSTPPPLIIEASLSLGIFFNLSLSPDPENLIKPGAGAVFGFEGMIQIQLITIGIAAAYGVGITKVKAYVDFTDPKPIFEFTFGFGATVVVDLPVVGLASITRSFSLGGNIDSGKFKAVAGQMLRGVLSLAGGLLVVSIQIEGSAGVERKDEDDPKTTALFAMEFSLDVSLAFVISYDFTKTYTEEIALN